MNFFCKDDSKFLDKETLENLIDHLGEPLSKAETQEFISSISYNEENKISFDDFVDIVMKKKKMK